MTSWGLQQMLHSAAPRFELIGTTDSLARAKDVLMATPADVVVADADDPGITEDELTAFIGAVASRVLVITGLREGFLEAAIAKGLHGIVRKCEPPDVLLKAIEKVSQGELWIDRHATGRIFMGMVRQRARENADPEGARIATLTARERQAIEALASDVSAPGKVIASRLRMSEHTLRNHLSSIYTKLNLANRLDLYAYATRHLLAKPGEINRSARVADSLSTSLEVDSLNTR